MSSPYSPVHALNKYEKLEENLEAFLGVNK